MIDRPGESGDSSPSSVREFIQAGDDVVAYETLAENMYEIGLDAPREDVEELAARLMSTSSLPSCWITCTTSMSGRVRQAANRRACMQSGCWLAVMPGGGGLKGPSLRTPCGYGQTDISGDRLAAPRLMRSIVTDRLAGTCLGGAKGNRLGRRSSD